MTSLSKVSVISNVQFVTNTFVSLTKSKALWGFCCADVDAQPELSINSVFSPAGFRAQDSFVSLVKYFSNTVYAMINTKDCTIYLSHWLTPGILRAQRSVFQYRQITRVHGFTLEFTTINGNNSEISIGS